MAARGSVPSEQRIFSLVLALVVSPEGATKHELLSSVYGYAERYRPGERDTALERLFERDKERLRALGIRVETRDSPSEPGNNQLTRYRIAKADMQFPEGVRFDERELMLLRVAAYAWREGSLSAEARRATHRLEALGAGRDRRQLGIAPDLGSRSPAAAVLSQAIDARREVRFLYTNAGRTEPLERHVAPLALHRVDGRWHLLGRDVQREADRVYLLERIEGRVAVLPHAYDTVLVERVPAMIEQIRERLASNRARVRVRRGSVAEARLFHRERDTERTRFDARGSSSQESSDAPGAWRIASLGYLDEPILAAELVGYGADAVVIEPASLARAVTEAFERILDVHGASYG